MLTDRTSPPAAAPAAARPGVTRRTVLATGAGVVGAGVVAAAVGVPLARPTLALDGTLLATMVGQTFVDTETGTRLVLGAVDGLGGRAATAERFAMLLTADDELPAAVRTLRHPDGDLHLYLGPVGGPRTLEAVVDRTGGAA